MILLSLLGTSLLALVSKFDEVRPNISFATAYTAGVVSMKAGGPLDNVSWNLIIILCNDLLFASSSEKRAKITALLTEQRTLNSLEITSDWTANLVHGHTCTTYLFDTDPRGIVWSVVVGAPPGAVLYGVGLVISVQSSNSYVVDFDVPIKGLPEFWCKTKWPGMLKIGNQKEQAKRIRI